MEAGGRTGHSWLGITSFVLSILTGMVLLILVVVLGFLEASTPGGIDEESPTAVVLGLLLILALFAELVGLGFGIAGLFQRRKKRIFAIFGIVFSVLVFLVVLALIVFGLLTGG